MIDYEDAFGFRGCFSNGLVLSTVIFSGVVPLIRAMISSGLSFSKSKFEKIALTTHELKVTVVLFGMSFSEVMRTLVTLHTTEERFK